MDNCAAILPQHNYCIPMEMRLWLSQSLLMDYKTKTVMTSKRKSTKFEVAISSQDEEIHSHTFTSLENALICLDGFYDQYRWSDCPTVYGRIWKHERPSYTKHFFATSLFFSRITHYIPHNF